MASLIAAAAGEVLQDVLEREEMRARVRGSPPAPSVSSRWYPRRPNLIFHTTASDVQLSWRPGAKTQLQALLVQVVQPPGRDLLELRSRQPLLPRQRLLQEPAPGSQASLPRGLPAHPAGPPHPRQRAAALPGSTPRAESDGSPVASVDLLSDRGAHPTTRGGTCRCRTPCHACRARALRFLRRRVRPVRAPVDRPLVTAARRGRHDLQGT